MTEKERKIRENKFKRASKADKRRMIAEDAIMYVNNKTLVPKNGRWVSLLGEVEIENSDVKPLLNSGTMPKCEVCALGGALISTIGFCNSAKFEDLVDLTNTISLAEYYMVAEDLRRFFGVDQLKLMEVAFEVGDKGNSFYNNCDKKRRALLPEGWEKAARFGGKFRTPQTRFIGIFKNIIENGEFNP